MAIARTSAQDALPAVISSAAIGFAHAIHYQDETLAPTRCEVGTGAMRKVMTDLKDPLGGKLSQVLAGESSESVSREYLVIKPEGF